MKGDPMSNPLRNQNIDYERGWFSVTVQVAHNKSVFELLNRTTVASVVALV